MSKSTLTKVDMLNKHQKMVLTLLVLVLPLYNQTIKQLSSKGLYQSLNALKDHSQ